MRPIIFNGKFYSGELNGVHRVADRLIREVDAQLAALPAAERPEARLLLPRRRRFTPDLALIRLEEQSNGDSQRWEQLTLPGLAKGGVLVNLCNLAPIRHPRKILLVHDAQFLFSDSSYPPRQRWGYRLLIPAMARASRRVLTVSHYSRQILDITGVSRRHRTEVLYNGVDHILDVPPTPGVLADLVLREGRYVLLFGSIKRYKNIRVVFEAFDDPRLSDVALVIVGDDAAALRNAGLTPPASAVFAGRVDDGVLRALYQHAICLAFPSRTEGFGLPPMEAMILGCPALVAPGGAIPEICHDAACYAGVDEPEEWADAIVALASDRELRKRKIAAGHKRAATFTWAKAGTRLLDEALALATGP